MTKDMTFDCSVIVPHKINVLCLKCLRNFI